jgi:hypothetical protein
MRMLKLALAALMVAACCLGFGWGPKGHRIISNRAADAVTGPAGRFFRANRAWLAAHSSDADDAKKEDKAEGPRHYLDVDVFLKSPFEAPVWTKEDWGKKFGDDAFKHGLLPWATADRYRALVEAFRKRDRDAVLTNAAWLGHYVADAHMPFHAVKDYDGVAAGQKGIHWYVEGDLINTYVNEGDVVPGSVVDAGKDKTPVEKRVLAWLAEGAPMCDKLLAWDKQARTKDGERDLKAFSQKAKPLVVHRLKQAAERLAMLWQSAWIEAGKPEFP